MDSIELLEESDKPKVVREIKEKFLVFRIAQRFFGIRLGTVKEVLEQPMVTPLPDVPPDVEGIINLRGSVITVVDLQQTLGITKSTADRPCIVIAEVGGNFVGSVVDEILQVESYDPELIDKKRGLAESASQDYIYGIVKSQATKGKLKGELIVLLDIEQVFKQKHLEVSELIETEKRIG